MPTASEFLVPTDTVRMWCRQISGAVEIFADVTVHLAHGTKVPIYLRNLKKRKNYTILLFVGLF